MTIDGLSINSRILPTFAFSHINALGGNSFEPIFMGLNTQVLDRITSSNSFENQFNYDFAFSPHTNDSLNNLSNTFLASWNTMFQNLPNFDFSKYKLSIDTNLWGTSSGVNPFVLKPKIEPQAKPLGKSGPITRKAWTPASYKPLNPVSGRPANNSQFIQELDAEMQEKVRLLETRAREEGIPFTITCGYRSYEEQKALYNKYISQQ